MSAEGGCPCSLWDSTVDAGATRRRTTDRRSRRAPASPATSTARSPRCGSTRARRTPVRTPATSGRRRRHAPRHGHVHERDGIRAGSRPRSTRPCTITAGHAVHRVVASRRTGYYAYTGGYFNGSGHDIAPLARAAGHARARPTASTTTARSGFPTSSFNGSNYWVDVVFETGPDTTAPIVTTRSPSSGATNVSRSTQVRATVRRSARPGLGRRIDVRAAGRRARHSCPRPSPTTRGTALGRLDARRAARAVDDVHRDCARRRRRHHRRAQQPARR